MMITILSTLKQRLARRSRYLRTVRSLRSMPLDVALDLDLYPGDAKRIASQAVYGQTGA